MRRSPCSQQCQTSLIYVRMTLVFLVLVCWRLFWCSLFAHLSLFDLCDIFQLLTIHLNQNPNNHIFILVSLFRFGYKEPLPIFSGANFSMYLDGIIVAPPKTIIQGSRKNNVGYHCEPQLHDSSVNAF
jgi:hypothetical protein